MGEKIGDAGLQGATTDGGGAGIGVSTARQDLSAHAGLGQGQGVAATFGDIAGKTAAASGDGQGGEVGHGGGIIGHHTARHTVELGHCLVETSEVEAGCCVEAEAAAIGEHIDRRSLQGALCDRGYTAVVVASRQDDCAGAGLSQIACTAGFADDAVQGQRASAAEAGIAGEGQGIGRRQ